MDMKESAKIVEHTTKVSNLTNNLNTPVKTPKMKERKDSVFKFGPEARIFFDNEIKSQEKAKHQKNLNVFFATMNVRKHCFMETYLFQAYTTKVQNMQ